jgi:hypothetical protein
MLWVAAWDSRQHLHRPFQDRRWVWLFWRDARTPAPATVSLIAKSATKPCTFRPNPHDCVSLSAILWRPARGRAIPTPLKATARRGPSQATYAPQRRDNCQAHCDLDVALVAARGPGSVKIAVSTRRVRHELWRLVAVRDARWPSGWLDGSSLRRPLQDR